MKNYTIVREVVERMTVEAESAQAAYDWSEVAPLEEWDRDRKQAMIFGDGEIETDEEWE